MVQRWNVCAIVFWRVVWYRAGTFLCMRSRPRRGCGCVVPWTSCPSCRGRDVPGYARRAVAVAVVSDVFMPPSCGCDTPMNASVCNGFGVVYVDSICLTFVRRV